MSNNNGKEVRLPTKKKIELVAATNNNAEASVNIRSEYSIDPFSNNSLIHYEIEVRKRASTFAKEILRFSHIASNR